MRRINNIDGEQPMDFVYLQTFCEVAKWGNFTRAVEALGYAQSSVTTQIQKLEEQYGATLFERYGRRMQPTQAGEVLLPYARQILASRAEAKALLSEQQTVLSELKPHLVEKPLKDRHASVVPSTNCASISAPATLWAKWSLSWNNDRFFSSVLPLYRQ
jgi:hypothetical protein